MKERVQICQNRLHGRFVFLSASVPTREPYRAEGVRRADVEEAVISLARAVFSEGGRLVFGGHPAISPLVAMVAGEYLSPPTAESSENRTTPILIYQSEPFREHLPSETLQMYRQGYASIQWTHGVGGEQFLIERAGQLQCVKSLRHMRERMIQETKPEAMVCIGGMEGVEEELKVFAEFRGGAPVYVIASTGGAAALIANRRPSDHIRVIDRELHEQLTERTHDGPPSAIRPPEGLHLPPVAYAVIMQTIVTQIISRESGPAAMAR